MVLLCRTLLFCPIASQLAAQEHVSRSVTRCVAPEAVQQTSPEEAHSALLGSSSLYGDGGPLASYARGAVSLPDDVAPFVTSVFCWGGPRDMARFYKPSDVIKRRVRGGCCERGARRFVRGSNVE